MDEEVKDPFAEGCEETQFCELGNQLGGDDGIERQAVVYKQSDVSVFIVQVVQCGVESQWDSILRGPIVPVGKL